MQESRETTGGPKTPLVLVPIENLGRRVVRNLEELGRFYVFLGHTLRGLFRSPVRWRLYAEQMERIGVHSVAIIALSSAAIGMIFALQMTMVMSMFQAEAMVGAAVGLTLARELAPVVTTLMLIAKNGSSMTAELGTMRVTEQIDAMETMSVDPIHYLVVPRLVASVIVFPILTGLANLVGILGAYLVAVEMLGVDPGGFVEQLYTLVNPVDVISGLIKAAVMGFMMSVICAYYGFYSAGGSKGVGESATRAVVTSSVGILIADYIMADLMLQFLY
ncbi:MULTISPECIES: MlaE family ABC transporter permease [Alkalispirochaeta]|uniref:MlaE family ABC transporter permease n=1 Tax=Alkalispirochaeta TaxID=2024958 RepID=UPI00036EE1DB|nr:MULTISPECIES: ABC transporter permease [Alkalispirochaeta]